MLELSQNTLQQIVVSQYFPTPSEVRAMARQLHELRDPELVRVQTLPDGVMYTAARA
jgi:hypothetical protein